MTLQRLLSTVTVLGLLVATAAAFAITERLKLVKSPIYGTRVSKRFSPTCGCSDTKATVRVKFRHGDSVTVTVLGRNRQLVRTLAAGERVSRGSAVFRWNGSTDEGTRAPDGVYRVEFHLSGQHRTILLPNRIRLDTTAPEVKKVTVSRRTFSPDGDGRFDSVRIRYELSEPAHAVFYLKGQKVIGPTRAHKASGAVDWYGLVDGKRLPAGVYVLWAGAVDLAGNATPPRKRRPVFIRIRYIDLTPTRIRAAAGSLASVGVLTDARTWSWRFAGRRGTGHGSAFHFRVPRRAGRYPLVLSERGHDARAVVVVGRAR